MSEVVTVAGVAVFAAGVVVSFAGSRLRARIPGLGAMAVGALLVLLAARPRDPATWWMAGTGGATLVGLIAFAYALGRWVQAQTGQPAELEEDPA